MGGRLLAWSVGKPGLTPKSQTVLTAMCKIADDSHGRFWKHANDFLREDLPNISSRSALRDHLALLQQQGYIGRVRCGSGKRPKDGDKWRPEKWRDNQTEYQIIALGVLSLEDLAEYQDIERRRPRRKAPIQPVSGGISSTQKPDTQAGRVSDPPDTQAGRVSDPPDTQGGRVSDPPDTQAGRVSDPPDTQDDAPYYMNTKNMNTKAVTANSAAAAPSDFFDLVARTCSEAGIRGIRPEHFRPLRTRLSRCKASLGREHAEWIVDEVLQAHWRDPVRGPGFVVHVTGQMIDSGGGLFYIEPDAKGFNATKPGRPASNW